MKVISIDLVVWWAQWWEWSSLRSNKSGKKKKQWKKWRYLKRQVPKSSTSIFALSGLWKENREWKGQNTYLNMWWLKTYLLKLWEETDIQTKEAQKILSQINPKISIPRHIIVKLSKVKGKERILKVAREKWLITYKGTPLLPRRLSVGFLRNLAGQERVGWYISEYPKERKPSN